MEAFIDAVNYIFISLQNCAFIAYAVPFMVNQKLITRGVRCRGCSIDNFCPSKKNLLMD